MPAGSVLLDSMIAYARRFHGWRNVLGQPFHPPTHPAAAPAAAAAPPYDASPIEEPR